MDFALSDEQIMLRDSVERLAADAGADAEAGWRGCIDLGLPGLVVPEGQGGFGGGILEAALVAEAFGHARVAAPFVSTAIIGASLLSDGEAAGQLAALVAGEIRVALATEEAGARYALTPRAAARQDGEGFRLTGSKIAVPDGASADLFVVSALLDGQTALFLVPRGAGGLEVRDYRAIDGRGMSDLGFRDLVLRGSALLVGAPRAATSLARVVDHASLLLAAEAVGAMTAVTQMTADYLKARHQFGRPLASFQVLAHRVADMAVKLDNARSMVLRGLAMADEAEAARAAAVSSTMVAVLQAAEFVCGQAIQLHGGIGMTEELAIGHYYKRVRAIGRTYGDVRYHLRRYADMTLPSREAA